MAARCKDPGTPESISTGKGSRENYKTQNPNPKKITNYKSKIPNGL
jgi:hypothetical protein